MLVLHAFHLHPLTLPCARRIDAWWGAVAQLVGVRLEEFSSNEKFFADLLKRSRRTPTHRFELQSLGDYLQLPVKVKVSLVVCVFVFFLMCVSTAVHEGDDTESTL